MKDSVRVSVVAAFYIGILVLIFAVTLAVSLFKAKHEAETFNKFTTGPKATTWDALFAELRVDARN